jgi:hypothetical protein
MAWRMDKFKINSNVPRSASIKFPFYICSSLLHLHQNGYCDKDHLDIFQSSTFAGNRNALEHIFCPCNECSTSNDLRSKTIMLMNATYFNIASFFLLEVLYN